MGCPKPESSLLDSEVPLEPQTPKPFLVSLFMEETLMFSPVLCGAGQRHMDIPSAGGKTQECEHQDIFLSRKPEASLHLQRGRWRAKHPTCPVSCTGQRAYCRRGWQE